MRICTTTPTSIMRYTNRFLVVCLALVLLSMGTLAGCDAFTGGFDKDPNSATEAPAPLVLTSEQVANIVLQEGNFARIAGMWAGQLTGSTRQYSGINSYGMTAGDNDNMWELAYSNLLAQAVIVTSKTTQTGNRIMRGIGRVVQANAWGTMTALFGDIPFTQALQPFESPDAEFTPQAEVYAAIQDTLSAALADLASGAGEAPTDIYFAGDPEPWIEVAHTLKARYFLHVGNYEQALAEAQQGISNPANNLIAPHGSSANSDRNIYYEFFDERGGYLTADGAYMARLLDPESEQYRGNAKTDESARSLYYYFDVGADGVLDANYCNGAGDPAENCTVRGIFAESADFALVTFSENQLIRAEALLQLDAGANFDAALEALNSVRAVLAEQYPDGTYEAYTAADFASGGIANPQGDPAATALLKEILEEKYVILYGTIEAFNDVRRTDNFLSIPPKRGNRIPERFIWAQSELDANENAPDPAGLFKETPVNAQINYGL